MPFNLLKRYNDLLDLGAMNEWQSKTSLMGVFNRDIANNTSFTFMGKQITPTPKDGEIEMSTLYTHLTTVIVDQKTRKREYDNHRAIRLHWVKYHIDKNKKDNMLVYSVKEPEGNRTYIYDKVEKYVIVLEPKKGGIYYLLTAYYVRGKDAKRNKFEKKYKRRLPEVL
jgi:hypothetical protein